MVSFCAVTKLITESGRAGRKSGRAGRKSGRLVAMNAMALKKNIFQFPSEIYHLSLIMWVFFNDK
jgi:hypothetical protein